MMVCVAFTAGGINAQSASIAKKNGSTSAYVEISPLLLAGPWYRSSCWWLPLNNRPPV